jgi:hypothetical protein
VFPHPLRLANSHLSEKAGLSGRLSDSCAEPVKLPEHYDGFIDGCNLGDNKSAVCICSGVIQHGLMSEIEA